MTPHCTTTVTLLIDSVRLNEDVANYNIIMQTVMVVNDKTINGIKKESRLIPCEAMTKSGFTGRRDGHQTNRRKAHAHTHTHTQTYTHTHIHRHTHSHTERERVRAKADGWMCVWQFCGKELS